MAIVGLNQLGVVHLFIKEKKESSYIYLLSKIFNLLSIFFKNGEHRGIPDIETYFSIQFNC